MANQSQSSSYCLGAATTASSGALPAGTLEAQAVAVAVEEEQEETEASCHVKSNPILPLSTRLSNSSPVAHPSQPGGEEEGGRGTGRARRQSEG